MTREEKIKAFVDTIGRDKGIKEQDFEPAPMSDKERMDMQEECIVELAELIGGLLE